MATTHALVGIALSCLVVPVAPELAPAAAVGGGLGGIFPDLDMVANHRRTLHFPVYYWPVAAGAAGAAFLAPGPWTAGAALFFLAAAIHSVTDLYGGGLELRPWRGTSDRAVYVHYGGRWLPPRRGVRYDGAPEDLALAAVAAIPPILLYDGHLRSAVVAGLVVSVCYAVVRKRLVEWAPERLK